MAESECYICRSSTEGDLDAEDSRSPGYVNDVDSELESEKVTICGICLELIADIASAAVQYIKEEQFHFRSTDTEATDLDLEEEVARREAGKKVEGDCFFCGEEGLLREAVNPHDKTRTVWACAKCLPWSMTDEEV